MVQLELFEDDRPQLSGPAAVSYRHPAAILNKGVGALKGVDYTLNPYVGCQFGCSYCYAAFFQADEEKKAAWGQWVDVKENAVQLIRRSKSLGGKLVVVGSATDPYQPIEAKLRHTRAILEAMAEHRPQPSVGVITRSPLAARDIDVFKRFSSFRISITIGTDDDEVRKAFEPGAPGIGRRLEALEQIASAGVTTGVNLAPLLPMRDPIGHLRNLKRIGVEKVWVNTFLKGSGPFSSCTGDAAFRVAKELGWTEERSEEVAKLLRAEWKRLTAPKEEELSSSM